MLHALSSRAAAFLATLTAYWKSKQSNIVGAVMALGGLAAQTAGHDALLKFHVPEAWIGYLASAAVILGALQITPKSNA